MDPEKSKGLMVQYIVKYNTFTPNVVKKTVHGNTLYETILTQICGEQTVSLMIRLNRNQPTVQYITISRNSNPFMPQCRNLLLFCFQSRQRGSIGSSILCGGQCVVDPGENSLFGGSIHGADRKRRTQTTRRGWTSRVSGAGSLMDVSLSITSPASAGSIWITPPDVAVSPYLIYHLMWLCPPTLSTA